MWRQIKVQEYMTSNRGFCSRFSSMVYVTVVFVVLVFSLLLLVERSPLPWLGNRVSSVDHRMIDSVLLFFLLLVMRLADEVGTPAVEHLPPLVAWVVLLQLLSLMHLLVVMVVLSSLQLSLLVRPLLLLVVVGVEPILQILVVVPYLAAIYQIDLLLVLLELVGVGVGPFLPIILLVLVA
jgi:hypothetical protein